MKTLKHLALAALVVAGLLVHLATTRPQPASSQSQPCATVDPLDVSGSSPDQHSYLYVVGALCTPVGRLYVYAGYDVNTKIAHEDIQSDVQDTQASTVWKCPDGDPWIAPSPPACTIQLSYGSPPGFWHLDTLDRPYSAKYLSTDQHHYLAARLQDEISKHFVTLDPPLSTAYVPGAAGNEVTSVTAAGSGAAAYLLSGTTPANEFTSVTAAGSGAAAYLLSGTTPANEFTSVTATKCRACSVFATPTPTPKPQPATYYDPTPEAGTGWPQLTLGTQGEKVKSLQYLLLAHDKSALPAFGVDGKFGQETVQAVLAFQQKAGLAPDGSGTVGQKTWEPLLVTVQKGSPDATCPSTIDCSQAVKAVQSQLNLPIRIHGGGQAVTVDGNFGDPTDAAVKAYQLGHSLTDDVPGQVGKQTWKSLIAGS